MMNGHWSVTNRRLDKILAKCDSWTEFPADYESWLHMDGNVSIDKMQATRNGKPFTGMSVRTFDEVAGEWTIYWLDSHTTVLTEQVRGRFENGEGVFYGEDEIDGVVYPLKFTWSNTSNDEARWSQAYQLPGTGDWETNWIMEFRRKV